MQVLFDYTFINNEILLNLLGCQVINTNYTIKWRINILKIICCGGGEKRHLSSAMASIFNEYLDYIRLKYMRHFVV